MGAIYIQSQVSFVYHPNSIFYSKIIRSGDKASPCFKPFLMGELEDRWFPTLTLFLVPSKTDLINLTNFFGKPNLIISYKDPLFIEL